MSLLDTLRIRAQQLRQEREAALPVPANPIVPPKNEWAVLLGERASQEAVPVETAATGDIPSPEEYASLEREVRAFFSETGPLVRSGRDIRPQQVEMSADIAHLLDDPEGVLAKLINDTSLKNEPMIACIEAPTGVGKSFSYLVPGILAALRPKASRLVVSTSNIPLQSQLIQKDIPAVAALLGVAGKLRFALLKARGNYVCMEKAANLPMARQTSPLLAPLLAWERKADCDGDKEHYPGDVSRVWSEVSVDSSDCLGKSCTYNKQCYSNRAAQKCAEAHVVVTNHAYLARFRSGMLSSLLVLDEAHDLEECLRGSETRTLTPHSGNRSIKDLEEHLHYTKIEQEAMSDGPDAQPTNHFRLGPVPWLMDKIDSYIDREHPEQEPCTVTLSPGWLEGHEEEAFKIVHRLEATFRKLEKHAFALGCEYDEGGRLQEPHENINPKVTRLVQAVRRFQSLIQVYTAVVRVQPDSTWVPARAREDGEQEDVDTLDVVESGIVAGEYTSVQASVSAWAIYAERERALVGGYQVRVNLVPADVSGRATLLAHTYPKMVLTSATLPRFDLMRLTLGFTGLSGQAPAPQVEKRLPSPFPLQEQGLLVIPVGPSPKDRQLWERWAVEQVVAAVKASNGGALVLATSNKQRQAYAHALRIASSGQTWDVREQGDSSRDDLRTWFANDKDGVLVATKSFFQGIDIQGDACRNVIIDKIPFVPPGDPVEEAVGKLLAERAGRPRDAFSLRDIPRAATILTQASGRLIRSKTDLGVLVILDRRVQDGRFKEILAGLPPFRISQEVGDIALWLDAEKRGDYIATFKDMEQARKNKAREEQRAQEAADRAYREQQVLDDTSWRQPLPVVKLTNPLDALRKLQQK